MNSTDLFYLILQLWLDYGSRVESHICNKNSNKKTTEEMIKCLARMNDIMKKFLDKAPPFYFLSVFPQLTSRICHAHADVWAILRIMLIKVVQSFSTQIFLLQRFFNIML